jgi:hypothetical protein
MRTINIEENGSQLYEYNLALHEIIDGEIYGKYAYFGGFAQTDHLIPIKVTTRSGFKLTRVFRLKLTTLFLIVMLSILVVLFNCPIALPEEQVDRKVSLSMRSRSDRLY